MNPENEVGHWNLLESLPELVQVIYRSLMTYPGRYDTFVVEQAQRIAAAVEQYVAAKPVVSSLPSVPEMQVASNAGGWKGLYDLIASRVTVAPPVDPPTRDALAAIVSNTMIDFAPCDAPILPLRIADAILAAFPKIKLRRMPTREEIIRWLRNARIDAGHPGFTREQAADWELSQADAVLAKLSKLAEPLKVDEHELAMRLYDDAVPGHLGTKPNPHNLSQARAAIAYFRERVNVTTKPTSPFVFDENVLKERLLNRTSIRGDSLRDAIVAVSSYVGECMEAAVTTGTSLTDELAKRGLVPCVVTPSPDAGQSVAANQAKSYHCLYCEDVGYTSMECPECGKRQTDAGQIAAIAEGT